MLLNIEKLIYGGDGLARLPAGSPRDGSPRDGSPQNESPANESSDKDHGRGKAVFIPFVLAGEKIEAAITEEKPGFARANAKTIVESSPHRIPPPCPHFSRCGGCHYQHASYEHQLEIKKEILRENLRRIAKLELQCEIQLHPSPPWNYRNRSRLQVRTRPDFVAGYFRFASHELLAVEDCPISSPLINRGIAALWHSGRAGNVVEGVRELEFFANADDTKLLIEMLCAPEARRAAVRAWAEEFCAAMPQIVGVAAFREPQKGVQEPLVAVGVSELRYQTKTSTYRVSAGPFFQTNRFLIDELINIVTAGQAGELALDLYAGVGLFSTALACDFHHMISVESSQTAVRDLQYNLPMNGKAIHAETGQYVNRTGSAGAGDPWASLKAGSPARSVREKGQHQAGTVAPHLPKPDLIVVDPPRSGLGDSVARALASTGAPRLTYVSCDPATLARDLLPLQAAGYRIREAHLVDLFPQTYHLESIVQLVR